MKNFFFTILIPCFFVLQESYGQQNLCDDLPPHEVLSYQAYYNAGFVWIYGGDVTFTARAAPYPSISPVYSFYSAGKTRKKYTWFYRIDDQYHSLFDCSTMSPEHFEQHTLEGNREKHWEYSYDLPQKKITVINRMSAETTYVRDPVLPVDILSAVYLCRFLPYDTCSESRKFRIKTLLNDSVQFLDITYHQRTEVSLHKNTPRPAYYISATIPAGTLFKKDKELEVYLSADKERIPLLVAAPVVIGWVKAVIHQEQESK